MKTMCEYTIMNFQEITIWEENYQNNATDETKVILTPKASTSKFKIVKVPEQNQVKSYYILKKEGEKKPTKKEKANEEKKKYKIKKPVIDMIDRDRGVRDLNKIYQKEKDDGTKKKIKYKISVGQ